MRKSSCHGYEIWYVVGHVLTFICLFHISIGYSCVLILLTSCQQTCMTYTIAVCSVKNFWWWTEELSETCRVLSKERPTWCHLLYYFFTYCSTCFGCSYIHPQELATYLLSISWVVLLWFDVCWCYVVVWLWWCGIRMQAEALVYHTTTAKPQRNTNTHRTRAIQPMK